MTVYVTPEIAERLRESSQVAGVPLGRHVGDMLGSLVDSIEYVSGKMAELRRSPGVAVDRLKAIDATISAQVEQRNKGAARTRETAGMRTRAGA
ncbi:hypothetical protein [Cupriavidus sp. WS]|uniref:hypothetical protein n=1 Tax=Cupriavidus sp. WS TaxID=1312922 RepID=UPI000361D5BE|nr:hypothetical protein [Cupriavidus sp. WS]